MCGIVETCSLMNSVWSLCPVAKIASDFISGSVVVCMHRGVNGGLLSVLLYLSAKFQSKK